MPSPSATPLATSAADGEVLAGVEHGGEEDIGGVGAAALTRDGRAAAARARTEAGV
jgi:hypothetical protein